jgi:NADH dehydrogenase (ubiquinone) Fe-S protein 1
MYSGINLYLNSFRGALTSKPYAFLARPWEFKSVDSIDVFDALGSNIRVDVRGDKLLRILPRSNDTINEDWISDRIRFVCDAIRLQRLDAPLLRLKGDYRLLTWYQALIFFSFAYFSLSSKLAFNSNKLKLSSYSYCFNKPLLRSPVIDVVGNFLDLNSSFVWAKLKNAFLCNVLNPDSVKVQSIAVVRSNFLLNFALSDLATYSSVVLVGFNLKTVAPLLAIRLRSLIKQRVSVYNFGFVSGLSGVIDVGSMGDFFKLLKAQHWLSNRLVRSKTAFIFGDVSCLKAAIAPCRNLGFDFGYFATSTSFINACESSNGSNFSESQNINLSPALQIFHTNGLLADIFNDKVGTNQNNLKLLSASHGGSVAAQADFVLPISAFLEHSKSYLNVVGVKQKTHLTLTAPNGVLDYSESLLLVYAAFFLKGVNSCSWRAFFLQLAQTYLLAPNNVWLFINKFFGLFESSTLVSCSLLVRSLLLPDCFVEASVQNSDNSLVDLDFLLGATANKVKFANKNSLTKNFTDVDFYLQDEISLVSSTLTVASRRLNNKETFL